MPKEQQLFLSDASALMPDYDFKIWKNEDLPMNIDYVKKAYSMKKYSNLSNFMRLFSLIKYGGIYLDTDVEVIKKFDTLLDLDFFIGHEDSTENIEDAIVNNAIMGASKNHWLLQECITYLQKNYDGLEKSSLSGPVLATSILSNYINLKKNTFQTTRGLHIFPCEYFHPLSYRDFAIAQKNAPNYISNNTFTIHHFYGSWLAPNELLKNGKFKLAINNIDIKNINLIEIISCCKSAIIGLSRMLKTMVRKEIKQLIVLKQIAKK